MISISLAFSLGAVVGVIGAGLLATNRVRALAESEARLRELRKADADYIKRLLRTRQILR